MEKHFIDQFRDEFKITFMPEGDKKIKARQTVNCLVVNVTILTGTNALSLRMERTATSRQRIIYTRPIGYKSERLLPFSVST